jgi:PKD domain
MRRYLLVALTLVFPLVAASAAQAVVIDPSGTGSTVTYPTDQSNYVGVALVPGSRSSLGTAGIPAVTTSAPCSDPALSPDLSLPNTGLCSHGGNVMHSNETFTLTWDPLRRYWQTTRNYLEQFLSDVAAGSGTLTSPYAVTGQYTDATGRAANSSVFGGGCIDYGSGGGSSCKFGNTNGSGAGYSYPASGCPVTGTNQFNEDLSGSFGSAPNDTCLTDAQLQGELSTMISQSGLLGHTAPGHTPVVVLLTPAGVVTCLDSAGKLCSANSTSTARFCSYHSQVNVGGTEVAYVVQPWTASWKQNNGCDEPEVPQIPVPPPAQTLAIDVGIRLVSPLSQGHLAAIVNPALNGWFALNGSEINDNGCVPFANQLDSVTVGTSAQNPYLLQHEFNNAGVIETDPNALACTPSVALTPTFVVPSAVNQGDVVQFDGSTTVSSLIVPSGGYLWSFGDGATAVGPSVVHSYTTGGSYNVKLTVTDRGANVSSLSQTIAVLNPKGKPVGPTGSTSGLHVRLLLMPQGLRTVLRSGITVLVSSNEPANGIARVSISRSVAKRAYIKTGRGPSVVIGTGTVSAIKLGTVQLKLKLSRAMAAKLKALKHVTLTVRLSLVAAAGDHIALDVAGRY